MAIYGKICKIHKNVGFLRGKKTGLIITKYFSKLINFFVC